ncbi:hypothetical protein [Arthrobacter sp. PAMC25284]|uniref:COG4315 family predicted lipoprotein n=1 Tax=Arthrobacter sp. PAMC25284 TaxID=2861279 RepID=UPI001C63817C|nr:hypothetical protein [Arthrobacter sp. PAMC25284]QYF89073.1 hypothetical protein KY499_13000 [Arthrobacter sp. PAMC25284]
MMKNLSIGLSAVALAALLSGCAGGSTTPAATTAPATTPAAASPSAAETTGSTAATSAPAAMSAVTKLMVADSAAGQIVVDDNGMSVYYFTKDTKDSGTSACTDGCLAAWPPVITDSDSPELDGVTGVVGTIDTPDGKKQLTLNGMPLYYFAKDKAAGDILGQGVNSVWYLAAPSGDMITAPAGS